MEVFVKKVVEFIFSPFFFLPAIVFTLVGWRGKPAYFLGYAAVGGLCWHAMWQLMSGYSRAEDSWKFNIWNALRANVLEHTIAFVIVAYAVYGLIRLIRQILG